MLGYLGMAVAGVVVMRVGLDLAVRDLSNADPARETQIADARPDVPKSTLAPVMSPSPVAWADADAADDERGGFGEPDPEFGRANPAMGQPAWSAAERQRQADAAEAAAAAAAPDMMDTR
jgi:hypothetical protein